MTRLRGWAPIGERLVDKAPHGHWKTATFLAALRNDRSEAPCLFGGPISGERFRAYVEELLVPTLKPGDVVILDNLGSHNGKAVRDANRAAGAHLLFPPKYSPNHNPIEQVFAKLKTLIRKIGVHNDYASYLLSKTPEDSYRLYASAQMSLCPVSVRNCAFVWSQKLILNRSLYIRPTPQRRGEDRRTRQPRLAEVEAGGGVTPT